jgi:heat-inducible transcriptional repressor
MLDDRKAAILRAVVEMYISTAQPVGSSHVARSTALDVSSATVRNEMAALEREGFLTQPHTSAGRIPTEKGYRFFVDTLEPGILGPPQRQLVREFFARAHGELEQMLHDTSKLLSDVTDHTAVVVGPPLEAATIRSIQIVGLGPRVVLLVVVLSSGAVEKRTLELANEIGDERVVAASAHLSAHLVGQSLGRAAVMPVPSSGDRAIDDLVRVMLGELGGGHDDDGGEQMYIGGAARTAAAFEAVQTVQRVLDLLEHQLVVVSLLRDVLDRGLSVAIGSEMGLAPLAECAVVVAPYEIEGEVAGTVGVLGPTRMNYPQALAAVAAVSQRLGRRLSEG